MSTKELVEAVENGKSAKFAETLKSILDEKVDETIFVKYKEMFGMTESVKDDE